MIPLYPTCHIITAFKIDKVTLPGSLPIAQTGLANTKTNNLVFALTGALSSQGNRRKQVYYESKFV